MFYNFQSLPMGLHLILHVPNLYLKIVVIQFIKARFHYEREKEHSLFVLLIFFCARFNFNRSLQSKVNKRNKECSFPRS